jgi:homocysteine S-methyltransferase
MVSLTDGGLETHLVFHAGYELPCFAAFPLLRTADGRRALQRYFEPFLALADEHGLEFVLDTATWRANGDWAAELGYDGQDVAAVNLEAVEFARELAGDRPRVLINGVIGPRGDGYVVDTVMTAEEATSYHSKQVEPFAAAGVDRISALTMTYPAEAVGVVRAAAAAAAAVVVSFTVETDGRLPDGTPISSAIERVDAVTDQAAEFFMINCAHPTHVAAGLDGSPALSRIGGLRVNASALSHAELDAAEEIDEGDPVLLGRQHAELRAALPGVRLLGGCCGTDHRHVAEILASWPG